MTQNSASSNQKSPAPPSAFSSWFDRAKIKAGEFSSRALEKASYTLETQAKRGIDMASASLSRAGEKIAQSAKETAMKAKDSVSASVKYASKTAGTIVLDQAKIVTRKTAEEARKLAKRVFNVGSPTLQSTQKLIKDQSYATAQNAQRNLEFTQKAIQDRASKSYASAQSGVASAVDAAKTHGPAVAKKTAGFVGSAVQQATEKATGRIFQNANKAIRWFFVWSLAVVAVYGIASTVPKELVKQWTQPKIKSDPKQRETESSNSDQEKTPDSQEKPFYQSLVQWYNSVVEPPKKEQPPAEKTWVESFKSDGGPSQKS